ncbi:NSFL1 cofactor p47-like isoform X2 [Scyliorhinus canicula]|uniref:NSFL1 cofactor p47-like isoform X2 n=1 Tax=Scyliorhinus canicula TaxID=7830 RepID=UPI0018F47B22|nr:NSFL1 cofactor p47-like isoform X2 [Scyliorhinus canicula]
MCSHLLTVKTCWLTLLWMSQKFSTKLLVTSPNPSGKLATAKFYENEGEDQLVHHEAPMFSNTNCKPAVRSTGTSRISSLKDLKKKEQRDGDVDEGQCFYAGGSEHSGQQIVGPPKNKNLNEIVDDLFKGAKEHGAVPVDHWIGGVGEANNAVPFAGGGYRLGASSQEQSEYVSQDENQDSNLDVQILLKLWKNGFSLDDGELRTYTDPTNAVFLESIGKGEIPVELQKLVHGNQVSLDMEDHRSEEYLKHKLKFKAFSGDGQKLGSPTPTIVSTPSSPEEEFKYFVNFVDVNDSEPTTNVQIRLADGSRLVQKFNQTHRISDIRQFIIQHRPTFATSSFVLMTTFPNKELTDEEQTLQEAKLLNAVIVQRLK